jgi:hypothetical protein
VEALFGISAIINIILLYLLLGKRWRDVSLPGLLYASVSSFFVIIVSASLVLTSLGTYSLARLNIISVVMAALLFLLGLFIWFSNKKNKNAGSFNPRRRKLELHHLWLLLVCLAAFFLYSSYTTEYIIGGRDPGVYANQGIYIGKTGGLSMEDGFIRDNYEKLQSIIQIGSPGFYAAYERGLSNDPGLIIPQFMPMFPSMLALGYSLFGIAGALKINAFAGVLSLLAFYAFGKQLIGRKGAFLAAVFLAFNPSQLWNARITQTELLSQFLFFSAVYVFVSSWALYLSPLPRPLVWPRRVQFAAL